jgi:hypothetical protein
MKKTKDKEWLMPLTEQDAENYERLDSIFRNNGYDPSENRLVSMQDAMDVPNAAFLIPRVLTTFVQEGIEPLLIGTSLLQRIDYVPGMQTVFPAIDVLTAREVGDGMSLPIFNINVGGGQTYGVTVKRHGLQLRISDRFVEQSTYPWLQWWMKLAGQALARHKEEYIFNFITMLGTVVFDNDAEARKPNVEPRPVKGITTGRNLKGAFNGSMTMDDVYDLYAHTLTQGFIPDTLLVHPMTYLMWVKDPTMREFAIQAGGGNFFQAFTGNAAAQAFAGQYNYGGLGQGLGQTGKYTAGALTGGQTSTVQGLPQNQNTAPALLNYLGLSFRIMVSPFVRFDPFGRTTDIMLFDRKNLGALIVDEDPHVNSWKEQQFGISNIGVEETYGFGIINEGQAITVAKNVAVRPNEFVLPARSVINLNEANSAFKELKDITNFGAEPTVVL